MSVVLEARTNTTLYDWRAVEEGTATTLRATARDLNRRLGWAKYRVRTLPSAPREHDVSRLPKWAQERLARAEAGR